ncbi:MAG TPA: hypothetical protein VMD29_15310 [Terracidiphilus sp.]|nr:hypothetical protein [Terracidiphilus sp.]
MRSFPRTSTIFVCFMLSLAVMVSGCKSGTSAADAATDPNDPANANVVPVSNSTSGTASDNTSATSSAAPAGASSDQSSTAQANENNGYGQEPETYAPQPPPQLPQYDQPPCPQEGDIWTPGYWAYAEPAGYYWVPGAWVQAPYVGALWTPGYWGWRGGRYAFYRGYWGRHIGFYGGINYGFGYIGFGYQGGYWRGNGFFYNTAVNRVNTTIVRNVYNYRITNITVNRISYNGGNGGVQYRPRASEIYAIREEHTPPMAAQVQIRETAMGNRETFYNVNHGRPAAVVETRAVVADRDVRPPAVINYERGERPAEAHPMPEQQRPEARPAAEQRPAAQEHGGQAHPAPAERRPEARPAEQHKPAQHPEQRPQKERPGEPR